jgi:hypothetical protein
VWALGLRVARRPQVYAYGTLSADRKVPTVYSRAEGRKWYGRRLRVARSVAAGETCAVVPETHRAVAVDGTSLAYQCFGEGGTDLLWVPGNASHLDVFWEYPPIARFLRRLGASFRVIWFDKRGTGAL